MSQLELAAAAEVSQRHLSFIETGRSRPRADVIRRLSEALDVPLRDRNRLLTAAGLPAGYPEVGADAPASAPFRAAVERLLERHEPYPAFVLDRWWDVVGMNGAARRLFPAAGGSVTNAVDAFLAPGGMREIVVNFPEVAGMYLRRLEAEISLASDERSLELLERARGYLDGVPVVSPSHGDELVICPRLRLGDAIVGTVTMVARFGATREVTLDELRVELIFPADAAAEAFFQQGAVGT